MVQFDAAQFPPDIPPALRSRRLEALWNAGSLIPSANPLDSLVPAIVFGQPPGIVLRQRSSSENTDRTLLWSRHADRDTTVPQIRVRIVVHRAPTRWWETG